MKVRDLVDAWGRISGRPFGEVDLFARRLREAGYLPQGAKGRTPPDIGVEHAATLVLAQMASDVARQAPRELEKYHDVIDPIARLLAEPHLCEAIMTLQLDRQTEAVRVVGGRRPESGLQGYFIQPARYPEPLAVAVSVWCRGQALEELAYRLQAEDVPRVT